jgi:hypothetical protein
LQRQKNDHHEKAVKRNLEKIVTGPREDSKMVAERKEKDCVETGEKVEKGSRKNRRKIAEETEKKIVKNRRKNR